MDSLDWMLTLATTYTIIETTYSDGRKESRAINHFEAYTKEGVYP